MRHNGGMSRERVSIGVVWIAAVVGVIGVAAVAAPERQLAWLSVLMCVLVLLTGAAQLVLQEKRGFIDRMAASILGAVGVLAVASALLVLLGARITIGGVLGA